MKMADRFRGGGSELRLLAQRARLMLPLLFALCIADNVAVLVAASPTILDKRPDFLKTCFMADPAFSQCSKVAVQGVFDQLSAGIPDIGIAPMDPLSVAEVRVFQGEGPVNVNAMLNNVKIVGFAGTKIEMNTVDPKTYSFVTKLRIPKLRIDGNYTLRGRILLLPLQGQGTSWFEPRNLDVSSIQDVAVVYRGGKRFFDLKDVKVDFKMGGLRVRMNNLFNGIKALEESTNSYINANWRPVAESLHPILVKTIEDLLFVVLKQLYDGVPADYFIGDIEDHMDEFAAAKNSIRRRNINGTAGLPPGSSTSTARPLS